MLWWAMTSWAADASSYGVGLVAGLGAGGPAVGINAVALRQLDVTREGVEDKAAVLFFGGELAVLSHSRFFGTFDPIVALPVLQAGAWFGRNVGLGPVLRLDALVGGPKEQDPSMGGRYWNSILDNPLLVTAYPSAGIGLHKVGQKGSQFAASLTVGPPFSSFDVGLPPLPTPAIAWSHHRGAHLGLRATRYQLTAELGYRL